MSEVTSPYSTIKVHPNDNVVIVINQGGAPAGAVLDDGIILVEAIPQGHKLALSHITKGGEVRRYNEVVGYAKHDIQQGSWVSEAVVDMPTPPKLADLPLATRAKPNVEPLEGYTFEGYRNADGSVGTKNLLGISTSVQCVAGITEYVVKLIKQTLLPKFPNVDGVVALNHTYGCGVAITAPAAIVPIRTLQNIAKNPNFGGEVMVVGLGCEKLSPSRLLEIDEAQTINLLPNSDAAKMLQDHVVSLQDENHHGFQDMVDHIMEMAESHLERLNQRRRETCPISELVVGMQCGGSDAFSGVTANPAVGIASDLIVRAGGSVMFSEVSEVRDAIHLLTPRAETVEVGKALLREMQWFDDYLSQGQADRSANTTPGNKKGGLNNIVEKSLGSITKSGNSSIVDVLSPGERIRKRGLNFAATPASDFICGTLQFASGMNIQVFTTGRGTPYGLEVAPVIKVSTNSTLGKRWHDLIDLDAGRIATKEITLEEAGWELFHMIIEVASGRQQVAADKLGLHNDLVLFNPAPVT
ncbi:galactarate dehydratase [Neptunomonas phycophila]|uniref:Galactarate dehydratase n=1 Tax=Neptunomonas phycophila TaxID=1572645 RepID=A0ABT9EY69_9GAMM|nr:galactarate dehydratase [Neptunomonas phycophila]MDO6468604.1 galactarate dehydratase [Neptunomonas phycophila]MDP2523897.1 galactarate dehydratase [Neptunomonas phycophila]